MQRHEQGQSSIEQEVTALVKITVRPQDTHRLISVLRAGVGPIMAHPACLDCRVLQDVAENDTAVFLERWRSLEALERHIRSEEYRSVLAAIELACEPPEVLIGTITGSRGIDYIVELRTGEPSRKPLKAEKDSGERDQEKKSR